MSGNFFSDALRTAMGERHFNQAQLAEFLKVDPAYISRWLKGSSPRLDQMKNVLETLGWDIKRAKPDYDPFEHAIDIVQKDGGETAKGKEKSAKFKAGAASGGEITKLLEKAATSHRQRQQSVQTIGTLNAADCTIKLTENGETHEVIATMLPAPDYADSEVNSLTVEGNALHPDFPASTTLFVRRALKISSIPNGCLVTMETEGKNPRLVMRRFVRLEDDKSGRVERFIGAPILPDQEYLFYRPREARIQHVVVAALRVEPVLPSKI